MGLFSKKKVDYSAFANYTREDLIELIKSERQSANDMSRIHQQTNDDAQREHDNEVANLEAEHQREIDKMTADHVIELGEKEFALKHLADEKVLAAETAKTEMEKKLAVAESENKMLREIADLNGDIIDIKELVTKLIDKLPEIKLNSITVTENDKKSK